MVSGVGCDKLMFCGVVGVVCVGKLLKWCFLVCVLVWCFYFVGYDVLLLLFVFVV